VCQRTQQHTCEVQTVLSLHATSAEQESRRTAALSLNLVLDGSEWSNSRSGRKTSDTEAGRLHATASLDACQWKFLAITGNRTADRVPCKVVTVLIALHSAAMVVQFARSRTERQGEHVLCIQTQLYPR